MPYREETIVVHGRTTRLLRGGTGAILLYLHDTFCHGWLPLHEQLAAHHEVIVPMHPGCGGSDGFEDVDTMEDLVFHYLDVCDALRLERPVLLGSSLGGWLAAEWAVRYSDALHGLVLLDALGLRVPAAPAADILRLDPPQTRAALFADPTSLLALDIVPDVPTPECLPGLLQARQTLARFAWQFPDNPKLERYLYRVHTPTLIIWGEQDHFVSTVHGVAYQEGIASAELVVLPQCGHLPHAEQPEACARTVLDFVQRCAASDDEP
jgi:pimeloyl-ACP methyl ester carboxylesterase